jgi:hypoxanthine phosphoribosyltransferase
MPTDPPGDLAVTGRDGTDDTGDAGVVQEAVFAHHIDEPALGPVVVGEADIRRRIAELGDQITADYVGRSPLLICVLKGAFVFLADLVRAVRLPLEVDFMAVSSYGASTKSSGVVRIVKDLDIDLLGRHVLLVEDIVDSGLTLTYLRRNLAARQPASLEVCALFVRQGNQKTEEELRYVGFEIPPAFVLGYGLDVGERFRNLPYVCEFRGSA